MSEFLKYNIKLDLLLVWRSYGIWATIWKTKVAAHISLPVIMMCVSVRNEPLIKMIIRIYPMVQQ